MNNTVKNCGKCPFYEPFLEEYEVGIGMVEKGRCKKWNKDEVWGIKSPCKYAEQHTIEELEEFAFDS